MSLLDSIWKKFAANTSVFSFWSNNAAPEWNSNEHLLAYKSWTYACTSLIAEEVANMNFGLYKRTKNGNERVYDHIALNLLYNVNPFSTSSDLIKETQSFLELDGNAFWYLPKGRATKKPAEIWTLDPTRVSIVKSKKDYIAGYVYKTDINEDIPFDVNEIIHFKTFNPVNKHRGIGTVGAAAIAIDTDVYAAKYNRNFFFNSAVPSVVLETPNAVTTDQFERLKNQWEGKFRGVNNANKTAILSGGMKASVLSIAQKDMQFLESRKMNRDEILAMFKVPKSKLGMTEGVTVSNADATDRIFARTVLKPKMQFIIDRLNEFYLTMFGVDSKDMFFDFEDPTPENKEFELKKTETYLKNGVYTINEVRAMEGKDPVEGGDTPYIPSNSQPLILASLEQKELKKKAIETKGMNRVQYIVENIKKNEPVFEKELRILQKEIIANLPKRKSRKKTLLDDLSNKVFENFEARTIALSALISKLLQETIGYSGNRTVEELNIDIDFDIYNPFVVEWIRENSLIHATSITGTIKDEVRSILEKAIINGDSIDDMANSINQFFDDQIPWRAARIARTEIIAAYAEGSLAAARQSGLYLYKHWSTAGDSRVDEHCRKNESDGYIPLESAFSSGSNAPPIHPNCRCILQFSKERK